VTLSVEVGRLLVSDRQLKRANDQLSSRAHFLEEECDVLMEKLAITKKEFDSLREHVVGLQKKDKEKDEAISRLAEADKLKGLEIAELQTKLADQAEVNRLKFEAIEARFIKIQLVAAEGQDFAQ
jgi:hypothetical protein